MITLDPLENFGIISPSQNQLTSNLNYFCHALWVELCYPQNNIKVLPLRTSECDLIWKQVAASESCSVVSESLQPHGLYRPWNSPGQNIGVGSISLLQGIFPTQGVNPGLPHCRQILYQLSHSSVQFSRSVMSDSLQPHGPYCPWNSSGQSTGVGSISLLQGIFPTQGSNPGLPHYR